MRNNGTGKVIAGILIVAVILTGVYLKFGQKTTAGEKAYTVEVVMSDGAKNEFSGRTDSEYVLGALKELSDEGEFTMDGEEQSAGFMINTICGERADYVKDKAYWAFYVNDEFAQKGVDTQPLTDGDRIRFEYTPG